MFLLILVVLLHVFVDFGGSFACFCWFWWFFCMFVLILVVLLYVCVDFKMGKTESRTPPKTQHRKLKRWATRSHIFHQKHDSVLLISLVFCVVSMVGSMSPCCTSF
jgi:thiosulfate reductase cytochrome b subunit